MSWIVSNDISGTETSVYIKVNLNKLVPYNYDKKFKRKSFVHGISLLPGNTTNLLGKIDVTIHFMAGEYHCYCSFVYVPSQ